MSPSDIEDLLTSELTGCRIDIQGGDGKFNLSIIGDVFEGLNAVKRQKMIYKIILEKLYLKLYRDFRELNS